MKIVNRLAMLLVLITMAVFCPSAKAQSTHNVSMSWTYTQGTDLATGFNVYRATVAGGPYAKLTGTALSLATLTYQDFTGLGNTKYFYVVTAIDISGIESVNSNEVSATFISSSPNAPTNVTATAH